MAAEFAGNYGSSSLECDSLLCRFSDNLRSSRDLAVINDNRFALLRNLAPHGQGPVESPLLSRSGPILPPEAGISVLSSGGTPNCR
jgi:hypothetical protein